MRAPHPSLQRLFGLAAVPAQRGTAWQALDASLARLDAHPGGPADAQSDQAALLARLDTLVQGAPAGAGLAPLLKRLLGGGGAGDAGRSSVAPAAAAGPWAADAAALARLQATSSAMPHGLLRPRPTTAVGDPLRAGSAVQRAAQHAAPPPSAPTPASRLPAMPWPTRGAAQPAPAAHSAGPHTGTPARRPERTRTHPLLPAGGANAQAAVGQAGHAGPHLATTALLAAGPLPPWPDANAARQHWQQRLLRAGLGAPWQAPMLAALPAGSPTAASGPLAKPDPAAGAATAMAVTHPAAASGAAQAAGAHSAAQALSQRLHQALRPLAAAPRPPGPEANVPAGNGPAWPSGPSAPSQAGRVGGFKGLAALGLPAAALQPDARQLAHQRAHLPAQGLALPALPALAAVQAGMAAVAQGWPQDGPSAGPQALIDQIEAALREQAVRNGISLDGLEPH